MQLKHRFPLFFSSLFSLLLATVMLTVYFLFSNFRKADFQDRLLKKAETTIKLLLEVKEVDEQLLKIIDRNSMNTLYDEKTLIFNDSMRLIYSSIEEATIGWSTADLNLIKKNKEVYKRKDEYDVLGLYYEYGGRDYYALISAEDKYGNRKLDYLKILLLGAFLAGTALVWVLSFSLSKKTLRPLDRLRMQMQETTSKNLTVRILEPRKNDEIKALSQSFNQMLDRINRAYKSQKDFTSNASHELRTPLARIVMQLENVLKGKELTEEVKKVLTSISEDAYQLSDIITSLLILSRIEDSEDITAFQKLRLDEVIFHCASLTAKMHEDFKLQFEIENQTPNEVTMEIEGDETLLKIAISNLFKNAYAYSDNQTVKCMLAQQKGMLKLYISNSGEAPRTKDPNTLFNTFTRGSNIKNKPGSGVGLSIVQRIIHYHRATMVYKIPDFNTNQIIISFPQKNVLALS